MTWRDPAIPHDWTSEVNMVRVLHQMLKHDTGEVLESADVANQEALWQAHQLLLLAQRIAVQPSHCAPNIFLMRIQDETEGGIKDGI